MKRTVTVLFLFVSRFVLAQAPEPVVMPIDSSSGAIQFREVVTLDPSLDTKAIIQKAKTWVATNYRSANDVVQQYDTDAGVLIAKGQFSVTKVSEFRMMGKHTTSVPLSIYETLTIEARPGRYRVTLSNYELSANGQRVPLAASRGAMSRDEYIETARKQIAGQSMERMIMKSVEKNADGEVLSERQLMSDVKRTSLDILSNLKQYMQKKADKDW